MTRSVTRSDIKSAAERIAAFVRHTPVLDLGHAISEDWTLQLKLENLQVTGSFKARGAFNALIENDLSSGVVAASGGNFGKAVGYASMILGAAATVFIPETSPREKSDPIASYGADLRLIPGFYPDALQASQAFAEETGGFFAHAFDQHEVMSGQGTIALELQEQIPAASAVLVAVGGGGLIGGIASWYQNEVEVVAVESELCPTLHEARSAGKPVDVEVGGVAASSLGAQRIGDHPWLANGWIDDSVLVSDSSALEAQRWLWDVGRLWVEPAAAVTIAALREHVVVPNGGDSVVAVISGGNVALGS